MLLVAGTVPAAQPDEDRNAATWYRRAIERMQAAALTSEERMALGSYELRGGTQASEIVRAALARLQSAFSALRRGAEQSASNFGLDYARGFELEMPHLGELREVARLMQRDAMVRLNDGDTSGAADAIASLYRVSGHFGDDRILISSLVGLSVFRLADQTAQYAIDSAAFDPGECGGLLAALETMPASDPFNIVGALANEQMITGWLRDKFPDTQSRIDLPGYLGLATDSRQAEAMLLLDDGQFNWAVDEAGELMGRVADVFMLDDSDEARMELQCLEEETLHGEHGAIAALVMPAYERVYDNMIRSREDLARRVGLLRAVASGECSPSELVNGAEWYLRAVEMIQELDTGFRAQLPRIVGEMKPIDADASQRLASASAIIDTLRAGSQAPRCDFSIVGRAATVVPPYLPGLREAFSLLQADALRLLHDGERGQGVDRLAIAYRMSGHLAGDQQLAGALVAHAGFRATGAIVRQVTDLEDAQRETLAASVRAMPARDPFGYMGAFERARREILKELHLEGASRFAVERTVRECDGDALLYLLVVATQREHETDRSATWQPLSDVLSLESLLAARSRAEAARALLAEGEVAGLVPDPVPDIGRVRERFAKAMEDYRAAVADSGNWGQVQFR